MPFIIPSIILMYLIEHLLDAQAVSGETIPVALWIVVGVFTGACLFLALTAILDWLLDVIYSSK